MNAPHCKEHAMYHADCRACRHESAAAAAARQAEADRRFGQPHYGHDERAEHRADDDGMGMLSVGLALGATAEAFEAALDNSVPDTTPAPDFSGGGGDFGGGGASGSW